MKILVTGSNGQVGSELILQGKNLGKEMIATDYDDLDITNQTAVQNFIFDRTPDIVINAAAYTAVDKAEDQQDLATAINNDGPAYLSQICSKQKIPLLHISTDYIFDGSKKIPYTEEDLPNPQGIYGLSKLQGENVVTETLREHIILRTAWVFGAGGNNFVNTMLRLGKERNELSIVADQEGGPTWAGDIAETLLKIATRYQEGANIPWGIYNYTGTPSTTWFEFAQVIFREATIAGLLKKSPQVNSISTEEYPTAAVRPNNSVLNCQKILSHLNIEQPDWRIGLKKTLQSWN